MPWEIIECMDGALEVNREGVLRIIRSSVQAESILANSSITIETHTFGPDLHSVTTDWAKTRSDTDARSDMEYREFFLRLDNGFTGNSAIELLKTELKRKQAAERDLMEKQRQAQRETMDNIEGSVHKGETALPVLEFIRDVSADTLMIGATVMSGGTLTPGVAAWISGAAFLKGAGKFEDTGRFGEAAFEFGSEFAFGLAGVGVRGLVKPVEDAAKAASFFWGAPGVDPALRPFASAAGGRFFRTKWFYAFAMAGVKAPVEFAKQSFISGKSTATAFGRAGTKFTDPVISELAKQLLPMQAAEWVVPVTAVMKYAVKKAVDKVTTPAKAAQDKPQVTATELTDASAATQEFIEATAVQPYPGKSQSAPALP
jgi:hypothetical protein